MYDSNEDVCDRVGVRRRSLRRSRRGTGVIRRTRRDSRTIHALPIPPPSLPPSPNPSKLKGQSDRQTGNGKTPRKVIVISSVLVSGAS